MKIFKILREHSKIVHKRYGGIKPEPKTEKPKIKPPAQPSSRNELRVVIGYDE